MCYRVNADLTWKKFADHDRKASNCSYEEEETIWTREQKTTCFRFLFLSNVTLFYESIKRVHNDFHFFFIVPLTECRGSHWSSKRTICARSWIIISYLMFFVNLCSTVAQYVWNHLFYSEEHSKFLYIIMASMFKGICVFLVNNIKRSDYLLHCFIEDRTFP